MRQKTMGLFLAGMMGLVSTGSALTIDGEPPTLIVNPGNPVILLRADFEAVMNAELEKAFNNTLDTARKNLAGFQEQKNLAEAFGNANAYSMNSATLQGFQNYSIFAVATGLMVGVQAPSTSFSYYNKIEDDIREKGDLYAGLGMGITFMNLGLNAKFLMPGLYLNAKYGGMKQSFGDFDIDFQVMGVGANYRLLDKKSLAGLVTWRGISLGSGFYMQRSKVNMHIDGDSIHTDIPFRQAVIGNSTGADSVSKGVMMDQLGYTQANPDAELALGPGFDMGLDISTATIPFDAVTGISVFWGALNLTAGVGFDLNFGSSEVVLRGDSRVAISSDTTKVTFTPAEVAFDGTSENGPTLTRFRVMTGAGIGLGPVKLDIPLIYYPASGFAFGLTAAVVW